jgi:hypothetical protein
MIADINKILVAVIALGAIWRIVEHVSMRTVRAKREAAAKLLEAAIYQEHMEAESVKGRELAARHLEQRRLELGLLRDETAITSSPGAGPTAPTFPEVVR